MPYLSPFLVYQIYFKKSFVFDCKIKTIMLELRLESENMKKKNKFLPVVVFILLLLGMALLPYIPLMILRINIDDLSQNVKIWYNFFCDLIFMIIVFVTYKNDYIKDFKNYFKNFVKNFETSFKYYFIGLIVMMVSNLIIGFCFKNANANNEEAVRTLLNLYPIYMVFSVSIYAPFIEETIFRKSIKNIVLAFGDNKVTKYVYIILSGFIFAAMHIIGMVTSPLDYLYIIPYMALGSVFAALYYKTDNIFSSITMHALHNTVAVVLYLALGIV